MTPDPAANDWIDKAAREIAVWTGTNHKVMGFRSTTNAARDIIRTAYAERDAKVNELVEAAERAEKDLTSGMLCSVETCSHNECTLAKLRTALTPFKEQPHE